MDFQSMDCSIIIPIYNARILIEPAVLALREFLQKSSITYEILLRDDASSDGSGALLKQLASKYSQVRCFYNETNQGLGSTLRSLLESAQSEKVIYCDVDLPFGVGIFSQILGQLESHDIVVASRYLTKNHVTFSRRLVSWGYYYFCKAFLGVAVRDIGSGTVGLRKGKVQALDLKARRFDIHVELFAKSHRHKYSIQEIPASFLAPQSGSFSIFRHGPQVVGDTLRFWRSFKN